jgi:hypothetical protein
MKTLNEISENLIKAIERYEQLPLDDVNELSEILRVLDVNLAYLVFVRDEYYKAFQSVYFNSKGTSSAAKERESEMKVPELDLVRKILRHYSDVQGSIRSQISLRKKIDR